ncbi:hypothetical protein [Nocardia sp. NPDC057227]|uniref:hypothetical protein n=1 Tax=Nocardia sp. NPDC057227 TaxID=3346056 RepID=UPI00362D087C
MNAIEKAIPAEVWRVWNPADDWKQYGEWVDCRPPLRNLTEGMAVTVDYADGRRMSFRVVGGQATPESELLPKMLAWRDPFEGHP